MRFWNELVATWGDLFSLSLTTLLAILGALLIGVLWYTWPTWYDALVRFRFSREGRRRQKDARRTREITEAELDAVAASEEELPEVEPMVFVALADRLAAQGRFAEAVRERLRAMVRELVDRGIITHHPGWTVTELADHAGAVRPAVAPPMLSATGIFSEIWYGKRPALSEHDAEMRVLSHRLHDAVAGGKR